MSSTDEFNIKKILFNKYNSLGKLCSKAQRIKSLDSIVKQNLDNISPELSKYCLIGSLEKNCLIIETSRSEFLTLLRFNTNQLLSDLRTHKELCMLVTIKFKVNPELEKILKPTSKSYSSKTSKENQDNNSNSKKPNSIAKLAIQKISENISNKQLKSALEKLSKVD